MKFVTKCYIALIFAFSVACKPAEDNFATINHVKSAQTIEAAKIERTNMEVLTDSAEMVKQVKGFILWYKNNYRKVNAVKFTSADKQGNYQVNINECTKYLNNLLASGYLSQGYKKAWAKYFKSQVQKFKESPMNEGPPEGFDYDLVFITQEPELVWKELNKMTFGIAKNEENKTVVKAATKKHDLDYTFEMEKENGVWKIAYISTMNYD